MVFSKYGKMIAGLIVVFVGMSGCALAPGMGPPVHTDDVMLNASIQAGEGTFTLIPLRAAVGAAVQSMPELPTIVPSSTAKNTSYLVGRRDVLSVMVWNHPDLMRTMGSLASKEELMGFVVQDDGSVYFPYAGKNQVEGKSVEQIRQLLTRKLSKVVKTPQVSVSVVKYASQRVYILGEVENPRMLALSGYPLTVLEAIAQAGGLKESASSDIAYLLRDGKRYSVHLGELLRNGKVDFNLTLMNGDVLHIPNNRREKVFVLGAVRKPMAFRTAGGGFTLSEALAESGGLDQMSADSSNVYVIRGNMKKANIYHLDMESADALLVGEQFILQPRDVVYVSTANITKWNRVLNLLLPNIQTLFYMDTLNR
ncbi:MAG: polysaccharide biosynthesis/export family protein [Gammaproteobacteria bacterium]|nr:polysaccharide biosynthesis/export family protein [Gammaproteobacteria bacterium]